MILSRPFAIMNEPKNKGDGHALEKAVYTG